MTMEQFCLENFVNRRGTGVLKWDSLKEIFGDEDLIALWVADMDFKVAKEISEAIKKRAEHGAFGYGKAEQSYYDAFFAWQEKHHGVQLKKENLRFHTGVVGALYASVNTYTTKGDSVIICPPVYYPFYDAVLNTGRNLVTCELENDNGYFMLNFEKFEELIKQNNVKLFILCSPHNPVSRVWSEEELDKMFSICKKHGVIVVSDEIHQDFTYVKPKFISSSLVSSGKYKDILVTLNSGSKTFNLAGLIHSHTIIFDEVLMKKYDDYIKTIGQPEANVFGLIAMEAAFRYGEQWLSDLKSVIKANYLYAKEQFETKTKAVVTPLDGTYLMWIDLKNCIDKETIEEFMIKKCKLAVDVGEWFSYDGKGFIRINLATSTDIIRKAIDSIINNLPS